MNESWPAIVAGATLAVIGAGLMWSHRRRWSAQRAEEPEDDFERRHLFRRYRRRMQTSGLILLIGLMVGLSPVVLPDPKENPKLFGVWWMSVLILAAWIVLLAIGDMLATRAYSQVALSRLRLRQRELERRLADMQRHQGNGRGDGA